MIEVKFKDRFSPKYPGRVTLTPVAGTNKYIFERADEPEEVGTPLDKATFNSIIHSRLTGRYYATSVDRSPNTERTGLTVSPLPTSGWVFDADNTNRAVSGVYTVETDSNNGAAWEADGAFTSGGWQSAGGDSAWIKIHHQTPIKVRNIRFEIETQYEGRFSKVDIQGSNDGEEWTTVGTPESIDFGATVEYALGSPGEYMYYRLLFANTDSNRVTVKDLAYTLYDIPTYQNEFTIADGVPVEWTIGQRLMIVTPAVIDSIAVVNNTVNGVSVNTILQPSKRYELRYTGTAFVAKEV